MLYVCCGSHLFLPTVTLHHGETVEMDERDAEFLVAVQDRPLVPATMVDFEFDGSEEHIYRLANLYHEYRSLLIGNLEFETESTKET